MSRRIIGIGSPFGADSLGWRAIDLLHDTPLNDAELIKLDRPGSDLIRYFEGGAELVLIDAMRSTGAVPGTPVAINYADLCAGDCLTSTHGIGVAEALQMAEQLMLLPDKLQLIGIQAGPDLTYLPEIRLAPLLALLDAQSE